MSDWDKVKQYILKRGYEPEYVLMDEYISTILLHLDGINESEDSEISVDDFLERFDEYGRLEDYDY